MLECCDKGKKNVAQCRCLLSRTPSYNCNFTLSTHNCCTEYNGLARAVEMVADARSNTSQ